VKTILQVGKFYPPVAGGMEQAVQSLCHITEKGLVNHALVFNAGRETVHDVVGGVQVTRVGTIGAAGSVPISPTFPAALRRAPADAIVLHEPNPWALLSLAIAAPRGPLAIWFHSEVVRPRLQYALFYHPLARAAYRRARRIVVSSPALAEHARALQPYRDRIAVIPFGLDPSIWQLTPTRRERAAAIRTRAGDRPLLLFAGRMVPYKGVDVLLRALAQTSAAAILAGTGPSLDRLTALARELGLEDRVAFAGQVPHEELAALYHACDMFVLPSVTRAEAFGYVQLEAMACAKPVISTRVPSGVPWVNRDGETGLTVPPGDVVALADAIETLARDEPRRARMGTAGRVRVATEFSLAAMRARVLSLYRELLHG
jgi:glycosyltransferase involved in cell wall biosynthesis